MSRVLATGPWAPGIPWICAPPLTFQLGVILNAAALRCFSTINEMTNHAVRSSGSLRYAITCISITLYAQKWHSRPSALASEAGLPVVLQRCRLKIALVARLSISSIVKSLPGSNTQCRGLLRLSIMRGNAALEALCAISLLRLTSNYCTALEPVFHCRFQGVSESKNHVRSSWRS